MAFLALSNLQCVQNVFRDEKPVSNHFHSTMSIVAVPDVLLWTVSFFSKVIFFQDVRGHIDVNCKAMQSNLGV